MKKRIIEIIYIFICALCFSDVFMLDCKDIISNRNMDLYNLFLSERKDFLLKNKVNAYIDNEIDNYIVYECFINNNSDSYRFGLINLTNKKIYISINKAVKVFDLTQLLELRFSEFKGFNNSLIQGTKLNDMVVISCNFSGKQSYHVSVGANIALGKNQSLDEKNDVKNKKLIYYVIHNYLNDDVSLTNSSTHEECRRITSETMEE